MGTCLVSVIIPSKNRRLLLQHTIASVQAQSHKELEVLVVDDCSEDDTVDWLEAQATADSRLRVIKRHEHYIDAFGAQVCRNLGACLAKGDFLLFLDSDDLLAPDCLSRRLAVLGSNPTLDFVVGQAQRFQDKPNDLGCDNIWGSMADPGNDLDAFLSNNIPWQTSGPLWKREALNRLGPWDEGLQYVGHDHEFHVRALCMGLTYDKLKSVDYYWRVPRRDSLSAQDSFKEHHANGGMIKVLNAICLDVQLCRQWTASRKRILAKESLSLALQCRLLGGRYSTAHMALVTARHHHLLSEVRILIAEILLRFWWRVGGRIPAMSLFKLLAGSL